MGLKRQWDNRQLPLSGNCLWGHQAPILPSAFLGALPRAKGRGWQPEEPAQPVPDRNQPAPEVAPPGEAVSGLSRPWPSPMNQVPHVPHSHWDGPRSLPSSAKPPVPCLASAMQEGITEVPAPKAAPQHLTQPQLHPRADPDPALVLGAAPAGCTKMGWRHGLRAGVRSHSDRVPALHPQAHTDCSHSTPRRALPHTLLRSPCQHAECPGVSPPTLPCGWGRAPGGSSDPLPPGAGGHGQPIAVSPSPSTHRAAARPPWLNLTRKELSARVGGSGDTPGCCLA